MNTGDLVYIEGASAIIGRVSDVDECGVRVTWRCVSTVEDAEELIPADNGEEPLLELCERWVDTRDNFDRVTAELTVRTGREPEAFIASMRELVG